MNARPKTALWIISANRKWVRAVQPLIESKLAAALGGLPGIAAELQFIQKRPRAPQICRHRQT